MHLHVLLLFFLRYLLLLSSEEDSLVDLVPVFDGALAGAPDLPTVELLRGACTD